MFRSQMRQASAGLSLVEVLVALLVFAVIGTAAFGMLDQTLRSESIADARLTRLSDMQRTMRILTIDTLQAVAGTVVHVDDGVSFLRRGSTDVGGRTSSEGLTVRYQITDNTLTRDIGAPGTDPAHQTLLTGVAGSFQIWQGGNLVTETTPNLGIDGIEIQLSLGGNGTLRGMFPVPHDIPPPP